MHMIIATRYDKIFSSFLNSLFAKLIYEQEMGLKKSPWTYILENVEHVGTNLSKLIQVIMSLMGDVIHQVNHPRNMHIHLPFASIYHSQGL